MKELLLHVVFREWGFSWTNSLGQIFRESLRNSIFQTGPCGEIQLKHMKKKRMINKSFQNCRADLSWRACLPEISKSLPVSGEAVGAFVKNSLCSKKRESWQLLCLDKHRERRVCLELEEGTSLDLLITICEIDAFCPDGGILSGGSTFNRSRHQYSAWHE